MIKEYGKVLEVYIPNEYNENGSLIDIMDRNNIGFKVLIDGVVKSFEFEQNEENSKIMKDDKVVIIKQVISNKEFIDIELNDKM